ncbi:DMT family transporter [Salicibibacter cibarius]|uniref:DMT family transporter n=1 Tax=Salicibibacter cibarius TaxID=2743000 RepID=UPI0031B5BB81
MDGQIFNIINMSWNIGDAIMLGAIFSWAIYSLYVKRYIHLFPAYGVLLVMTGVSVLILVPFVVTEWITLGVPTLDAMNHWVGLIYLGVFPSVIAILCYNHAVNKLGASRASIFLNFLPVFTMVGSYFFLDESITAMQIVGSVMVIVGVILTTREGKG